MEIFKPLAEQGNSKAQAELGLMYKKGEGVPQDFAQAAKWYRKAADQEETHIGNYGLGHGQYSLGFMYSEGRGVPKDLVQAYKWLALATAGQSESFFKEKHQKAVQLRDAVGKKLSPAQLAEAQKLAREWKAN